MLMAHKNLKDHTKLVDKRYNMLREYTHISVRIPVQIGHANVCIGVAKTISSVNYLWLDNGLHEKYQGSTKELWVL